MRKHNFERIKTSISTRNNLPDAPYYEVVEILAAITIDNYKEKINESLSIIRNMVKADRVYIFEYNFVKSECSNTFEVCNTNITSEINNLQNVSLEGLDDWVGAHRNHQTLYVANVQKLDKKSTLRSILEPQGIKSLMARPIVINNEIYGFLGFDYVRDYKKFTESEVTVLKRYATVLGICLDKIEYSKRLAIEEVKYASLFKNVGFGVWEWNLLTNEIKINDTWAALIGYTVEELKPLTIETWNEHAVKEDLSKSYELIQNVLSGKEEVYRCTVRMKHKNGHLIHVEDVGRVVEYKDGKPALMVGIHFDLTKQVHRQNELEGFKNAIESAPVAVLITDTNGNITYANKFAIIQTGYAKNELLGSNINSLKYEQLAAESYKDFWRSTSGTNVSFGDQLNIKKDGTTYWVAESVSPVFNEQLEIVSFITIMTNITKEREIKLLLEEQRIQLETELDEKENRRSAMQAAAVFGLAKISESRDHETGQHVVRVQQLSKLLAEELQRMPDSNNRIDTDFINNIYQASAIHDIGKVAISDSILLKEGKLTAEEFENIKTHVDIGANMLLEIARTVPKNKMIYMAYRIAKSHHEKWDGTGYNGKLAGNMIPLEARILALVDAYDAIRSKRPYKEPKSHHEAILEIQKSSGTHFDPMVVTAFMNIKEQFEVTYESYI